MIVALAVLLPIVLALAVYAFALRPVRLGGDEPHYLVMADSLITDRSFELHAAYERDASTRAIFGRVTPHAFWDGERLMPFHTPGLSMLVAIPQWLGGERAVRVFLCLLAALLPWSLFAWLSARVGLRDGAWLVVGITICTPILFGATRIFPDLTAGILATACALWVLDLPGRDTRGAGWILVGLAAGFLSWLNVKYYGTTAVFLVGALGFAAHDAVKGRRRRAAFGIAGAVCTAAIVLALVDFNVWAYGQAFGGRWMKELTSSFSRGAELFLGLHFDQSQGLFLRNPLLLLGVLLLPVFAARHPVAACFWGVLYLSLILPNGLEMARYGGGAPSGRFGWSAMWLWTVPIGAGLASLPRLRRLVPALVTACLVYQAVLAVRWLRAPFTLFPVLAEQLDKRDSLFPVGLRWAFPSFYFWDFSSYWTYPPNVVAFAVTAGLLAIGVALALRLARRPAAA
jgi:hypothetical protein